MSFSSYRQREHLSIHHIHTSITINMQLTVISPFLKPMAQLDLKASKKHLDAASKPSFQIPTAFLSDSITKENV